MIASLIYIVVGFIELLIGFRFVLLLLGANPASGFVSWIYSWSQPFVAPFYGIFGQHSATATGTGVVVQSVFDWTALIALVVYGFIAMLASGALHHRYPT
jgi:hypothetical protein